MSLVSAVRSYHNSAVKSDILEGVTPLFDYFDILIAKISYDCVKNLKNFILNG